MRINTSVAAEGGMCAEPPLLYSCNFTLVQNMMIRSVLLSYLFSLRLMMRVDRKYSLYIVQSSHAY